MGAQAALMVEEGVVGNALEPRTQLLVIANLVPCQVGLDEGLLRDIVRIVAITDAEGQQEPSQRFLFGRDKCYELLAIHFCSMLRVSASISLASIFRPT